MKLDNSFWSLESGKIVKLSCNPKSGHGRHVQSHCLPQAQDDGRKYSVSYNK